MPEIVLDIKDVTKTFRERGGKRFTAVDHLSLSVFENECVGIVGESGCGKSTLARMITRLILPDSGSIRFCGEELTAMKGKELRRAYRNMKMIFLSSAIHGSGYISTGSRSAKAGSTLKAGVPVCA